MAYRISDECISCGACAAECKMHRMWNMRSNLPSWSTKTSRRLIKTQYLCNKNLIIVASCVAVYTIVYTEFNILT